MTAVPNPWIKTQCKCQDGLKCGVMVKKLYVYRVGQIFDIGFFCLLWMWLFFTRFFRKILWRHIFSSHFILL